MSDAKELPEGMTCGDCIHWPRCLAFICTLSPSNTWCDFAPSRFVEAGGHLKASRALVEKLTRERQEVCDRMLAGYNEAIRQRDEERVLVGRLRVEVEQLTRERDEAQAEVARQLELLRKFVYEEEHGP